MNEQAWIALGVLWFLTTSGAVGGLFKLGSAISHRFSDLSTKIDDKARDISEVLRQQLAAHEQKDQERHEDTIQRLTRVETITLNGHNKKKARTAA